MPAVKRFLQAELQHHDRVDIATTPLNELQYEECLADFESVDSGVYVLKQAESICTGRHLPILRDSVAAYRSEILQLLFLNGKKTYGRPDSGQAS